MPKLEDRETREREGRTNAAILDDYLGSERFLDHLKQILPDHLDSDRFATIALRQVNAIPELKKCSLASVAGAIMQAGTLGLEIATQGECWLIPRFEKVKQDDGSKKSEWLANLDIGYLGHLALAWRSAQISAVQVDVVMEGDTFDFQRGTAGYLHHKPRKGRSQDPEKVDWAYAIVQTVYGGEVWNCIDRMEIERLRNAGTSANSPAWRNWYEQMAMGKVLKRTLKLGPKSREMARAITLDDQNDANISHDFALDVHAIPAEVSGKNPEAEEMLRRAAAASSQGGGSSGDEPPPPGDLDGPPQDQREPIPVQAQKPAEEKKPSPRGTMGF